jgi:hypothetical protein
MVLCFLDVMHSTMMFCPVVSQVGLAGAQKETELALGFTAT